MYVALPSFLWYSKCSGSSEAPSNGSPPATRRWTGWNCSRCEPAGRGSRCANTVRHAGCICTPDALFGVGARVCKASTSHYPLLHRYCVFRGGHGRFRQVIASRRCCRRQEGTGAKQPHPHLWRWPVFRRLYRGRHWWEGGRPPHRRLYAQRGRRQEIRPSAGEGGRPQVWR
jgi:hypothetical protein